MTIPVLAIGTGGIIAICVGVAILLLIIILIGIYNGLVSARNQVKNSFSQIDVQLNRRYDLIPNLVETAKGYMKHERETLESVTEARNQAMGASKAAAADPTNGANMKALVGAEGALTGALGRLMVTVEAYPDLKASQNMMQVQEELTSTENRIAFARQAYNDSVMHYNTKRETFPNSIVSGMFNFTAAESFEVESEEVKKVPKVSFS